MGTLLHRAKKMAETDLKTRAWIERLSFLTSVPPTE